MSMREIVTAVAATPPFRQLAAAVARSRAGRRFLTSLSPRRGIYESLGEAWAAARRKRHAGHEHQEAVTRHAELASGPLPSDYAILYWLNRIPSELRVFDYGGNMGNVFYGCARYVDTTDRRLQWTVYDLPRVIELGRTLASERTGDRPAFTSRLADSAGTNVLLVSGTYHYWEKSTTEFIAQFPAPPEHVLINRAPFYTNRGPAVSMQATLTFAFPILIRPESELIDGFTQAGYTLVDRWVAAEYGHVTPFFPEYSVARYSGFYFRRNGGS